ncbi:type II secretion system protein GspM [Marinobacter oulmenensis]|uniref:Type II secretion system protein M n=1 Tax=Marinobacter oulmenensis TaxID=643747 RepID=A0A840UFJ4_9GAMM|nr:type II secretion system protein GspM [Marinobacter oulmenensis]MBB5321165.1 type II secretory pathway component PulM [Marinobacter oulmenensis]
MNNDHAWYRKLTHRYQTLSPQDRRALLILGIAVVVVVAYAGIYRPSENYLGHAEQTQAKAEELHAWIIAHRTDLDRLQDLSNSSSGAAEENNLTPDSVRQLMSLITTSANDGDVKLQRLEPSGEEKVSLWVNESHFTNVAKWLETLTQKYKVTITQATLDQGEKSGTVSARITVAL